MPNFCPHCAQPLSIATRACPRCGAAVASADANAVTVAVPAAPPPPGYGSYAPPRSDAGAHPYDQAYGDPFAPRVRRYPKASPWARLAASLLDALVGVAVMVPAIVVLALTGALARLDRGEGSASGLGGVLVGAGLLLAAIGWGIWYSFVKDGWRDGASVGKRALGLMVVHLPTGAPCTMGQSSLRALVLLLLNFVPLVGWLVEPILTLAAEDGRRLGDRAADTQVIAAADYRG